MLIEEEHKFGMHKDFFYCCPLCESERKISFLKEALEKIKEFGYKNSGFGYSCAKIAQEKLEEYKKMLE